MRSVGFSLIVVFGCLSLALPRETFAQGADFYVKADAAGANTGASWNDALTDLEEALDAAFPGEEIWVAKGAYRPSKLLDPGDPRSATFRLKDEVPLYGGFAGTEGERDQRDPAVNETILTGDLAGDDGPGFSNIEENSHTVVTGSGVGTSSVLDGFTITGGNSNAPIISGLSSTDPTRMGGGMFIESGSPTIANCRFVGNFANSGGGGGVNTVLGGEATFTNCMFSDNSAIFGGGMNSNLNSTPTLIDCTFTANSAVQAGALYCWGGSPGPTLVNCRLVGNSDVAIRGQATLTDCTISRNESAGVSALGRDFPAVSMTNCVISANGGHGITTVGISGVIAENCTIWGNGGGGIRLDDRNDAMLTNCVLSNNVEGSFPNGMTAGLDVSYSCIEGDDLLPGPGNINDDPLFCAGAAEVFVDDQGGFEAALRIQLALSPESPCLGTGSEGADMGAETRVCETAGDTGRVVNLAPGVYWMDGVTLDDNVSLQGAGQGSTFLHGTVSGLQTGAFLADLTVTGGTSGGIVVSRGQAPEIRDSTIIVNSGTLGGGVLCVEGASPTLTRCTISRNLARKDGGGLYSDEGSSPTLIDCTITGNVAQNNGGGVVCFGDSSPVLTGCTITENSASAGGGVLCVDGASPTLVGCTIARNSATRNGGGILSVEDSSPTLTDCQIRENSAALAGGGIFCSRASLTLTRCEVSGNSAESGAGAYSSASSLTLEETEVPDIVEEKARIGADVYVNGDATGAKNGASWDDAFTGLQLALDAVFPGDSVWVARGTYFPSERFEHAEDPRAATFVLKNGVAFYGGFAGTETSRDSRDPEANATILSGDLDGDDGQRFSNRDDNCYSIFIGNGLDESTVLDGFTITGGNSDTPLPRLDFNFADFRHLGGGMLLTDASRPTIANCRFVSNISLAGGAINCQGSSPTLTNCAFLGNSSGLAAGYFSHPRLVNCTFIGNEGALSAYFFCEPEVINCTFTENSGYAIISGQNSGPSLLNCIVWDNEDAFQFRSGGRITANYSCIQRNLPGVGNFTAPPRFCWGTAEVFVEDQRGLEDALDFSYFLSSDSPCIGTGKDGVDLGADHGICDEAAEQGRLVRLARGTYSVEGLVLERVTSIEGSGAEETVLEGTVLGLQTGSVLSRLTVTGGTLGGVFVDVGESPEIRECTITGNTSSTGGGVACAPGSSPTLTNCLISGNEASGGFGGGQGGGVYCGRDSSPTLINCTVSGNSARTGAGILAAPGSSPTLTNCISWDNDGAAIEAQAGSEVTVTFSCVEGEEVWPGEGNTNADPLFVGRGDYHLQPDSAAIDAGTPEGAPKTDIEGNPRPCGRGVDMGPYEDCSAGSGERFIRGDCDADGTINGVTDAVSLLSFNFLGLEAPGCFAACDANGDGETGSVSDAVYILAFSFSGGPAPVAPYPECGPGLLPGDEALGCESPPNDCQ